MVDKLYGSNRDRRDAYAYRAVPSMSQNGWYVCVLCIHILRVLPPVVFQFLQPRAPENSLATFSVTLSVSALLLLL